MSKDSERVEPDMKGSADSMLAIALTDMYLHTSLLGLPRHTD